MAKSKSHIEKVPCRVKSFAHRYDYIIEMCRDKRVLHLGCVDSGLTGKKIRAGKFLHEKIKSISGELWGVDIDMEGINLLKSMNYTNLIFGDVENLQGVEGLRGKEFDIIIASELIEHLSNPGLFLASLKPYFSGNTLLIITTPNAQKITDIKYRLKGYELVHPDHNFWFSYRTLKSLLEKNGYKIIDAAVYGKGKSLLKRYFSRRLPFLLDGLIFTVRP